MKKKTLIGIVCSISLFVIGLSPTHAQQQERPIVRLIYFLPSDRQPEPDIEAKMERVIKEVQQHYADEMERLGYGKKTFKLETGANGKAVVHHVKGTSNDAHYRFGTFNKIADEISKRYDTSKDVYFVAVNTATGFDSGVPDRGLVCGLGGYFTLVRSFDECFTTDYGFLVAAHELGHTFGLQHDFRNNTYLMSYGGGTDLSPCDAEWLDVHRAFNSSQPAANKQPTIEMLPPSLASPPNAIRFRFKVTDPEGIHQARLHTKTLTGAAAGFPELISCKQFNGNPNSTAELVTTYLGTENKSVSLQVMDVNGNFTMSEEFPVNIASLLPRSRVVSIPDTNLAAAVREEIGNSITTHTLLNLTRLDARNRGITNLAGLEQAHNLRFLNLGSEYINAEGYVNSNTVADVSPLAGLTQLAGLYLDNNTISDVSPLAELTQLTSLELGSNAVADVSPIAELTQLTFLGLGSNAITDVSPIAELTQLTSLWLQNNHISDVSPLAELKQLTTLYLDNNTISDVSPLAELTQLTSLELGSNAVADVSPIAELTQLTFLGLGSNAITDVSPIAELTQLTSLWLQNNHISDVSPLAELKQLTTLYLDNNTISDVSPLTELTQLTSLWLWNNNIIDVSPLVDLNLTGTQWDSTGLSLGSNPLSYASINTHIPAMQARGITVKFDPRTPKTLVKISGAAQQGVTNTALALPFVVEVRDQQNRPFAGVPVTFSVTPGGGRLSTTSTVTDAIGRATAHLTLGRTPGTTTVRATATNISQPVQFNSTAILLSSPVSVADANLRLKIAETLNKPRGGTLTAADMLRLATLTANDANIRDLTGLQHASNLTTLSLENNNISDVVPLTGLTQLTSISLSGNNVSHVAPLEVLTQLETLSLDDNNISDVTPLAGMVQLKTLSLDDNNISDVSPLTSLRQLKILYLRENLLSYSSLHTHIPAIQARNARVTFNSRTPTRLVKTSGTHGVTGVALPVIVEVQDENGFPFSGVPVTFTVRTGGGQLSTSNIITNATGRARTTLTLGSTPGKNTVRATAAEVLQPVRFTITSVNASSTVTIRDVNLRRKIAETLGRAQGVQLTAGDMLALRRLEAPNASIQDLTGLEKAHNLTTLNLSGEYIQGEGYVNTNKVSDFSPLTDLAQLQNLTLFFCSLSDVSFLSSMTQLTSLRLSNNDIRDISPLAGLTQLTHLDLSSNPVSDVSPLARLTEMKWLYLYGTPISDVSPLSSLAQLASLGISGTVISDVSLFAGLTQLTSLTLSGTSITDIAPLAGLTQLTHLNLGSNNISDITPLSGLTQLTTLYLNYNSITDVSALADLTQLTVLTLYNNSIIDVSPLVDLNLTGTQWDSTGLSLGSNPLSYTSINTHIPAMQARGITVKFDPRTPTTLVKITGAAQQSTVNAALPLPFVVEVRDQQNLAFAGVSVTFTITTGNGRLSATTVSTDATGRAETHLTLGQTAGRTTVRVSATNILQPVEFTATAILLSSPVTVADVNLRLKIAETLSKSLDGTLTVADILRLTTLTANNANISDLTGLQHASNLTTLSLDNNNLSDVRILAGLPQLTSLFLNSNNISDVAPLEVLTQLETLSLDDNNISNVTPLAELIQLETLSLENNNLSDVSSLTSLTQLKSLGLRGNLLSYPSLHTFIPTIQANGTTVAVDTRTPTTLAKLSGTHGVTGASLSLIVEVHDENGFGFSGVPVSFTVTAGGGQLPVPNVITDASGRARTTLTLGSTPGKNTVRATAVEVGQPTLFSITTVDESSPVTIRDVDLRAKIAETLSKPRGVQLTAGDMLALRRLEASNANIQNLTGLEHAHNLTSLNLGGEYIRGEGYVNTNKVSDFSPLTDLAQLQNLTLFFCSLSDVSFLSSMTQLTSLRLSNNDIRDISPLARLTQLTHLDLSSNPVSDVSPLARLTEMRWLYLYGTPISDVSSLSSLTQLASLGISGTVISDVSLFAGLTQLTSLTLSGTSITDIAPLAGLTQLTHLNLGSNNISDITPLSGLTQLTTLYLNYNSITDVSALADLTQLTVLNLYNNSIIDVSPLVDLNLTGTQWNSTGLYIERNPLNYASVYTHIPVMQARGIEIQFDNRAHSALVKISGDTQEDAAGARLATPLVVKAMDPHGVAMRGLSVSFRIIEGNGRLSATTVTTDANGRAQAILTLGPNPGVNKIRVTAEGITYPVFFTAIATASEPARLAADVNGDGVVNIQDLVLVSSNFGKTGENSADVNGDGAVNIADLVLVAGVFSSGAATAPALHPSLLAKLSIQKIQQWLDEAKHLAHADAVYLRGIAVLEQLLIALIPKETVLLANYPNPFNPETWIPYQLSKPAEVTLHIYSVNGALVRTLALGYQRAGMYHSKSRAAYWDGRNAQGERVASGIYFYMLSAGDFTATRKMLIRK